MRDNLFSDFKSVFKERSDAPNMNFRSYRLRSLNIDDQEQDKFFDLIVPPQYSLGPDFDGNPDPGSKSIRWFAQIGTDNEDGDDNTYITIQDVSGPCNEKGINSQNQNLPCSPTNGRKWRVTRKRMQFLKNPLPPGTGGGGNLMGGSMMGGAPGGF